MSVTTETAIQQTKKWIRSVVIGLNFCPFAGREFRNNTIHYQVEDSAELVRILETFQRECVRLDENAGIETTLIILPNATPGFEEYLDLVDLAERFIEENDYEGIYQVASFHPQYLFAGASNDDPANYTNRSIYPMLHLLREESVEKVIEKHPNTDDIPEQNIQLARDKGLDAMKKLWRACLSSD